MSEWAALANILHDLYKYGYILYIYGSTSLDWPIWICTLFLVLLYNHFDTSFQNKNALKSYQQIIQMLFAIYGRELWLTPGMGMGGDNKPQQIQKDLKTYRKTQAHALSIFCSPGRELWLTPGGYKQKTSMFLNMFFILYYRFYIFMQFIYLYIYIF